MDPKEPTCFTCGLALTDPPRLNHLASGAVCPSCRDRLLEVLPPLLPGGEPTTQREPAAGRDSAAESERVPAPGPAPRASGPRPSPS